MTKLLVNWESFDCTPQSIKESREANGGKILLKGILQKADTVNQNGRIYPRAILEREVRNYQKFIIENRALGECVPPGTEIYTKDGWKNIESISDSETIFTLNLQKNAIELQKISEKVVLPFSGKLLRFSNYGTYDMCVTPNHKVLMWDRKGNPYSVFASELKEAYENKDSKISHSSIKRSGATWVGEDPGSIVIGKTSIDSKLWASFLGIYLAEGHSSGVKNNDLKNKFRVVLTQKNKDVCLTIENLLSKMPYQYEVRTRKDGLTKDYIIIDEALHSHLFVLGSSRNKYIPNYIKGWDSEHLQLLLDWMMLGDGRHRKNRDKIVPEYCTTSTMLANDVAEIMFKLGHGATIHTWDRSLKDRPSPEPGRLILAKNSADMKIVYQHSSKGMSLDFRFMKVEDVDYDGDVYCVRVPNSTWLMRYNGKVCWTHNCDHPDSSVVNLKNASHIVREAVLDGNVVKGVVELLNTPSGKILQSLVEDGVKLGISSRGVGSTKKQGDYQVVQEDFQLICWDFVSEPSTPGAFMLAEGKEISSDDLKKVFNRSDRIDRILNDIIACSGENK